MADKILWQTDDELNETNFAEAQALQMTSGYVERGLGLAADFANNNFDVGEGVVLPRDGDLAYVISMDARTDVSLPNQTGMNYIYVGADIGADSVSLHVDSDDTPPSNPNLKIGEIDASAGTTTELNRGPTGDFSTLNVIESMSVGSANVDTNVTANSVTATQGDFTDLLTASTIDASSLQASGNNAQLAIDGMVVPIAPGLGTSDIIDPSSTTTPVSDAISAIEGASGGTGGTVLLPPTRITNDAAIQVSSGISIKGWGAGHAPDDSLTVVEVTSTGTDLIRFEDPQGRVCKYCTLDGFVVEGPGTGVNTGYGVHVVDGVGTLSIGSIHVRAFANSAWFNSSGARITGVNVDHFSASGFDPAAGGVDRAMDFTNTAGAGTHFGVIDIYPIDWSSGSTIASAINWGGGGMFHASQLNIGGVCERGVIVGTGTGFFSYDACNFEPQGLANHDGEATAVLDCYGSSQVRGGATTFRDGGAGVSIYTGYYSRGAENGNHHFGPLILGDGDTLSSGNRLIVGTDTTAPITTYAQSSEVSNTSGGTLTVPVSCLGDMSTVS